MINKKIITAICLILGSCQAFSQNFTLRSKDLDGQFTGKFMSGTFGCNGENISPELSWSCAPSETRSFAVTMYDPDAPTGSGWWHWVVFDIPAQMGELKQGAGNLRKQLAPKEAIQSLTDFGTTGYGGPCPPENDKPHSYIITVYALNKVNLGLDKNASPALVGFMANQNVLAKASIIVYSKR